MKLVDILARELKVWPVKEGECNKESDYCAQSDTTSQVFFCGRHGEIFLSERADETSGVRVTRVEWQAAVDALNAPKVVEWDGVGLPPVGVSCEMSLFASNKWELCIPVYYLNHPTDHSDQVVVYQNSLDGDVCYILDPPCSGSIEFRPFRTAEQVAADEREKAIKQMIDDDIGLGRVIAEWVYDAGYRKEANPCGS